jgi:hypothetical protein
MPAGLKATVLSVLVGALSGVGFSWGLGFLGAPT